MSSAIAMGSEGSPKRTGQTQLLTVERSVRPSWPTQIRFGSCGSQRFSQGSASVTLRRAWVFGPVSNIRPLVLTTGAHRISLSDQTPTAAATATAPA